MFFCFLELRERLCFIVFDWPTSTLVLPQTHRLNEGFIANLTNMISLVEMSLCVHPQLILLHELFWTHRALEFFYSSVHPLVVRSDGE